MLNCRFRLFSGWIWFGVGLLVSCGLHLVSGLRQKTWSVSWFGTTGKFLRREIPNGKAGFQAEIYLVRILSIPFSINPSQRSTIKSRPSSLFGPKVANCFVGSHSLKRTLHGACPTCVVVFSFFIFLFVFFRRSLSLTSPVHAGC